MAIKFIPHITAFFLTASPCVAADIYHQGWIDFNKNGRKDVYEDSKVKIKDRIDNLLSKMTIDEKTGQMVTLYGWGRASPPPFIKNNNKERL